MNISRMLVTGLTVQDVERWRKHLELRQEYDPLRRGSDIVKLPRKALNTLTTSYLYPKPTQVGRLSILRGAR